MFKAASPAPTSPVVNQQISPNWIFQRQKPLIFLKIEVSWQTSIRSHTHLSEFGTGFFLLHPTMGHQVIKDLSWEIREREVQQFYCWKLILASQTNLLCQWDTEQRIVLKKERMAIEMGIFLIFKLKKSWVSTSTIFNTKGYKECQKLKQI